MLLVLRQPVTEFLWTQLESSCCWVSCLSRKLLVYYAHLHGLVAS
jgi:hypothetical protein